MASASSSDAVARSESARDIADGALCKLRGVSDRGHLVEAIWKCWSRPPSPHLRWELRRLLPSLGFTETKSTPLNRLIRQEWTVLAALCDAFGHDRPHNVGRSLRALRGTEDDGSSTTDGEQEFWVSTLMMLLFLCDCRERRRRLDDRCRAQVLLRLFLECSVPLEVFEENDPWSPPPDIVERCTEQPVVNGRCICLQRALVKPNMPDEAGLTPQGVGAEALFYFYKLRQCEALRAWVSTQITRFAAIAERRVEQWAQWSWQRSDEAACQALVRQRRVDPHVRDFCLRGSVASGQTATVGQVAKTISCMDRFQVLRMREDDMSAYRAAALLSFRRSHCFSLVVDAARVGKPAKDYMLGFISDPSRDLHGALPPQVLKDWLPARAKAVADMNPSEKKDLKDMTTASLRVALSDEASQSDRHLAVRMDEISQAEATRKANRHWVAQLDNALVCTTGQGLSRFLPRRRLEPLPAGAKRYLVERASADGGPPRKRACVLYEDGTRAFELPQCVEAGTVLPNPVLHMSSDMGSVGFAAQQFLLSELGLRATSNYDIFHRLQCDLEDATKASGLMIVRLEFLQVNRLRKGPFRPGGANVSILRGAAQELFECSDENNPIFELLFLDLVHEAGMAGVEEGSPEHLKKLWLWCMERAMSKSEGDDSKLSRWWSYEIGVRRSWDRKATDLLILLFIGLRRKWWSSRSQLPLFRLHGGSPDQGDQPLPGEAQGEAAGAALAATGGGELVSDGPSAHRVSTESARDEARRRRKNCVNCLHFACEQLRRPLNVRLWGILGFAPLPLERAFGQMVREVKTQKGVEALMVQLSSGRLLTVCYDLLSHLMSEGLAHDLEFVKVSHSQKSEFERQNDIIVMNALFQFITTLCGNIAVTHFTYAMPPLSFLGAISDSSVDRVLWLASMQSGWEALVKLEAEAFGNAEAAKFLHGMAWPRHQWPREVFLRLLEVSFAELPSSLQKDLQSFARSHNSSLMVEDTFNNIRLNASMNRKGACEACNIWHRTCQGSSIMTDYDRKSFGITEAARLAAPGRLPGSVFTGDKQECSLGSALDSLSSSSPSWPNHSAASWRATGLQWQLTRTARGEWNAMSDAWLSLLAMPGTLIIRDGENQAKLVLFSSQYGYIAARTPIGPDRFLRLAPAGGSSITFGFIRSPSEYRTCPVVCAAPGTGTTPTRSIRLGVHGGAHNMLKYCALQGFRTFSTVVLLKRLWRHLEIPTEGRAPLTEAALLRSLVSYVLGAEFIEGKLKAACIARSSSGLSDDLMSQCTLFEQSMSEVVDESLEDEQDDIRQQWEELKEQRLAQQKVISERLKAVGALASGGSSAPSSAAPAAGAASSSAPRARRFIARPASGMSAQEAKQFLPPGASISKDDRRENRWRVRAEFLKGHGTAGGERSKSYGKGDVVSDHDAMVFCIQLCWRAYIAKHGGECPFDW